MVGTCVLSHDTYPVEQQFTAGIRLLSFTLLTLKPTIKVILL